MESFYRHLHFVPDHAKHQLKIEIEQKVPIESVQYTCKYPSNIWYGLRTSRRDKRCIITNFANTTLNDSSHFEVKKKRKQKLETEFTINGKPIY